MLKICPCCKYVSNLYQTITFTSLLRINTYLANTVYVFAHTLADSANVMQIWSSKFTTYLHLSQTLVNPFFRPVKGPLGFNVLKNPARYICTYRYIYIYYCGQITTTFSHSHQARFAHLQINHCRCIK